MTSKNWLNLRMKRSVAEPTRSSWPGAALLATRCLSANLPAPIFSSALFSRCRVANLGYFSRFMQLMTRQANHKNGKNVKLACQKGVRTLRSVETTAFCHRVPSASSPEPIPATRANSRRLCGNKAPANPGQAEAALVSTGTFLPIATFDSVTSSTPSLSVAFTSFGSILAGRSNTRKI